MAEVYRMMKGRPFDDWLAHTRMVRATLREEALRRADVAKAIHAQHHYDGHSYIEAKRGTQLDWFVILNDTRGLLAAMAIEFGRREESERGPSAGTATLHRTFNLPMDRITRRRRRKKER